MKSVLDSILNTSILNTNIKYKVFCQN